MAKVIAVANMKGGVGKTTTVVSLAETLAAHSIDVARKTGEIQKSVLVIDLDAQASASFALAGDEQLKELIEQGRTLDGFLHRYLIMQEDVRLSPLVRRQISDVSHQGVPLRIGLMAASPYLRTVERRLIHGLTRGGYSLEMVEHDIYKLLSVQLQTLFADFDYVIFDCPPGISALTEVALRLADLTLVPTTPDFLSFLGLDAFSQNVWAHLAESPPPIPGPRRQPHVLVTKRKQVAAQDRKVRDLREKALHGRVRYEVLRTEIPEVQGVSEAMERVATFPNYARKWSLSMRSSLSGLAGEVNELLEIT